MLLPYKRLMALALCLPLLNACSAEDEGEPFDSDDIDETFGAGKTDGTGGYQPGCDVPAAAPAVALGGTLLLPTGPRAGYVVVQGRKITQIVDTAQQLPVGITKVETGGVISPGLVDLHNHVAYNFIPLWQSGKRFQNRYQWARVSGYSTAVKTPYNAVKGLGQEGMCAAVKYGELRALVGGTSTIQGSADLGCVKSWARNVEYTNFCEDRIRQNVLAIKDTKPDEAARLNAQFGSGQVRAYLVHLAEGIDDSSRAEFESLRKLDLLKPQVVGIHSTALTEAQLQEMGKIGMKVVWSPLSNLILYGKTTNVPAALKAGVTVALAPDWSPSGSANVLGELKVADKVNKQYFGSAIKDEDLFKMVTDNAARVVGLQDKIGRLEVGLFADLVVLRPQSAQATPYRALIDARPQDVLLTMVDGEAFYGDPLVLDRLGFTGKYETVSACGESRGLRAATSDSRVPSSSQKVADLTGVFQKAGVSSYLPLFQCDAAPSWAFQGVTQ